MQHESCIMTHINLKKKEINLSSLSKSLKFVDLGENYLKQIPPITIAEPSNSWQSCNFEVHIKLRFV